nr:MAG TPA: hypothetical protein [Caudoviricetes sp.]
MSVKRSVKSCEKSFSHLRAFHTLPVKSVKRSVKSQKVLFTPETLALCGM